MKILIILMYFIKILLYTLKLDEGGYKQWKAI